MSRAAKELRRLAREFLSDRIPFWEFHEAFIDRWTRLDRSALPEADREGWNEIYGWTLKAIPDPVAAEDAGRGILGEAELRLRLAGHPLLAATPPGRT